MVESKLENVSVLISEARRGDAQARDRLFALCRTYLGFVARSQVESSLRMKVNASDLVQETMLEAFRDFARFEGASEQEWLAWLRRILPSQRGRFRAAIQGDGQAASRREMVPLSAGSTLGGAAEPAADSATPSQEFLRLDTEMRLAAAMAEAHRLPGGARAAEPAAAALCRGSQRMGSLAAGRADALDAHHQEVAGVVGAFRRCRRKMI